MLLCLSSTSVVASIIGDWRLAPEAGAISHGPSQFDYSYWQNDADDVLNYYCLFDDIYSFGLNGVFNNIVYPNTASQLAMWPEIIGDQCSNPISQVEESNTGTYNYDPVLEEVTLYGQGVYIGQHWASYTNSEGTPLIPIPSSITYSVYEISETRMELHLNGTPNGLYWRFILVPNDYVAAPVALTTGCTDSSATNYNINALSDNDSCLYDSSIPNLNGLSYSILGSEIRITGCLNPSNCPDNLNIPTSLDGKTVSSISENAFNETNINSVIIPNTISLIESMSFRNASLLQITLSENLVSINQQAFMFNQFTTVSLPSNLTDIGIQAFAYGQLTSIAIPSMVVTIEQEAFRDNQITNLHFDGNRPNIASDAFLNNNLTYISYCPGTEGWPGSTIQGITPQPDQACAKEIYAVLDIDQDGMVSALTDGLMILRYLFRVTGDSLVSDTIGEGAQRTDPNEVEAYLDSLMP
jgi:hypothetical protein